MRGIGLEYLGKWKDSVMHLIFPAQCIICGNELEAGTRHICHLCTQDLHFTHFEKFDEATPLDKLFWGRLQLAGTYSLLYFRKGLSTQRILHALKYQSKPQVGEEFGEIIGSIVKTLPAFQELDAIIPVPIHPKKEFFRGYNQSEELAKGISTVLNIPVDNQFLKKNIHTGSQTKLSRFARWDNVTDNFSLRKQGKKYRHVAIVDDVITTGSTIEALVRSIQENYPEIRVSIISLALAQ